MVFRAHSFARGEQKELPGFDHDLFAKEAPVNSYTLESITQEYLAIRESSILMFHHLSVEQLKRSGVFGGNRLSVSDFQYVIAGHQKHHLEVLKKKY